VSDRACEQPGCGGQVLPDGYCDTCGTKAASATGQAASGTGRAQGVLGALGALGSGGAAPGAAATAPVGGRCQEGGCGGTVLADGYCDTCGTRAGAVLATASAASVLITESVRTTGFASGSASASGSRRVRRDSTRTTSARNRLGSGLVDVPAAPPVDPSTVVMDVPEVAEAKRYCGKCGEPVGRSRGKTAGRPSGFCSNCRTPFDFVPKLAPGDLVGGQYEVVGCLAHGGLGWIYLAKDTAVSDRWVVLKGLLNAGDDAAMAAAVAERRFLAEVQHPQIVEIYNFATHDGAGYTVMEYVGGKSLKQVLKARRNDAGATSPLDVETAIAYILGALPAFGYLHDRGLVYCDFKPDNLIQVGDDVKLIDLGGVRRIDDPDADIYGTVGFQAPEVAKFGVSLASDLYTIGRTLAVLTLDWPTYTTTHVASLPDPLEHPALRDNEPFLRFLRKATAPHPDDRFQTVDEFRDQLFGVLRILVAARTLQPRPGQSMAFAGHPARGQELPWLAVNPSDPAAPFLTRLTDEPAEALEQLGAALRDGQIAETVEVGLRWATDLVELGRTDEAIERLTHVLTQDPWEWRAVWIQGGADLVAGRLDAADRAFDRCRSEVPGDLAPLFASAMVAERANALERAAALYDLVSLVDPAWTTAAFGLARVRMAQGRLDDAVAALDRIPSTHRDHLDAQLEAATRLADARRVQEASQRVEALGVTGRQRTQLDAAVLRAALEALAQGSMAPDPQATVVGVALTDRGVRLGLERAFRDLARTTTDGVERIRLVDDANAVRPMTVV